MGRSAISISHLDSQARLAAPGKLAASIHLWEIAKLLRLKGWVSPLPAPWLMIGQSRFAVVWDTTSWRSNRESNRRAEPLPLANPDWYYHPLTHILPNTIIYIHTQETRSPPDRVSFISFLILLLLLVDTRSPSSLQRRTSWNPFQDGLQPTLQPGRVAEVSIFRTVASDPPVPPAHSDYPAIAIRLISSDSRQ